MSELLDSLGGWEGFTAIVVGDFMLDQLVYGDAERLTADAPVPVLHVRRTEETPGGAASVCLDLAAMHARVLAFGVIGDDLEGRTLGEKLAASGIDCDGLVIDPDRPTTVKRNLIGLAQHRHPQKMFRVDYESRDPISNGTIARVRKRFEDALSKADVVALEDYNKGVCSERVCQGVIRRCRDAGVSVLVDPAAVRDFGKYRGCSAITPNRSEAERATGLSEMEGMAEERQSEWMAHDLRSRLDCEAVVLTLDKHGALLAEDGRDAVRVPTVARQVYDVTGAGDMILAALCGARANGMGWVDAVRFANAAAGLEVEVFGVQAIPFELIHRGIIREEHGLAAKLYERDHLRVAVEQKRREGKRVVFTNGCFDVLHSGHVSLIEEAKDHGDFLVVGINTDAKVREYKGPNRPVNSETERALVLSGLQAVDAVVIYPEDTPLELIELLRPDVLVKGSEYEIEEIPGAKLVEGYGGCVVRAQMKEGISSTTVLRRMNHPGAEVVTHGETRKRFVRDAGRTHAEPE